MTLLVIVLAALLLSVSLAISIAISIPLVGTLVRFRANYSPKAVHLDQEDVSGSHVGPLVTSYWAMFNRVKRIEGIQGFYKGLMPELLNSIVLTISAGALLGVSYANPRSGRYSVPRLDAPLLAIYTLLVAILAIPFTVVSNRAITTPKRLPWFDIRLAASVLLTPAERRRPWMLYLIPGLVASKLIHILYVTLFLHPFSRWAFPSPPSGSVQTVEISLPRFGMYVAVVLLSTAILCPLEVIATRLSLQRNGVDLARRGNERDNSVGVDRNNEEVEYSVYAGEEEDVIGLRSEDDPYMGMVDCGRRILEEEGVGVLYRAWWLTFLFSFSASFV